MEKMECPICQKKALFVGVHDDEGNYHGLVGCEYENDPWSGLSYALHHDGWGECPLCTDGAYSTMGGMLFDTAEDAISAMSPPNEPLTIEQLQKMDGEPVYVVPVNEFSELGKWCVLSVDDSDDYSCALVPGTDCWCWRFEAYEEQWLAYRRPPEGEEDTCAGCVYENNEHEECNYCRRAAYLSDYYYRPPEEEI